MSLVSCEDFLQREPLDFGNDQAFLKNVDDMRNYTNGYSYHSACWSWFMGC